MLNLENTFGIIRPLRPAQTQIILRIRMSVDDITFTQTVLYGGKMSPGTTLRFRVTLHNAYFARTCECCPPNITFTRFDSECLGEVRKMPIFGVKSFFFFFVFFCFFFFCSFT